jgi:3-methyladenine DNA glycosylase AlkC
MTSTRGNTTQTNKQQQSQQSVKDIMNQTSEPNPKANIVMMDNKKTPSNYQMKQVKTNMDNLTKKLSSVKVSQPRNISFSL